ncbi:MAG: PAS domain-containing protein, partial [Desulfobulbaceae bacterium]|nr:PAS domain-containing protein [Desulfobulbaceae bacterium]
SLYSPESWQELNFCVKRALSEGTAYHLELVMIRPSGEHRNTIIIGEAVKDKEGRIVGLFGVVIDITERKRAEEKIRESEKRLKYAQQIAGLGFWDWNIATGDLYWSDQTYIHYGFKPQEFVPTFDKFCSIVHPDDLAFVRKLVDASLQSDAEYDVEFRFVRPNGEMRYLYTRGEVTRDANGKAVRFVGSQIDITERKQAAEALLLSRNQMEAVAQIGAMSNSTLDIGEVLSHILMGTLQAAGASVGMIFLRDQETGCLEWGVSHGLSEAFEEAFRAQVIKPGEGLTGLIAQTGETVYIPEDSSHDPRIARPVIKAEGLHSFIGVPVYAEDKIVAVMNILTRPPDVLREEKIALIKAVGTHVGFAIRNAQLFKERRQAEEALRRSHDELELRVEERTAELTKVNETLHNEITERKRAEEALLRSLKEKEVLLKEIHHRVKNNMQVIHSLLNLQAKGIADSKIRAMFEESRNRVRSMAMIHEKLYRSMDLAHIDFKKYLESFVQGIADTYKRDGVVLSVDMESIALDVNVGIPCGLIVNELISNSFKYAFPEGRKGVIRVGLNKNSTGNYVLIVEDNGIGLPADVDIRNTPSLGLQLVNMLTEQLRGTLEFSRSEWTSYSITFPGENDNKGEA